jgi:hypothetical protein
MMILSVSASFHPIERKCEISSPNPFVHDRRSKTREEGPVLNPSSTLQRLRKHNGKSFEKYSTEKSNCIANKRLLMRNKVVFVQSCDLATAPIRANDIGMDLCL